MAITRGLSIQKREQDDAPEPVSIDELKGYLKIDSDDHDELIYQLIQDARGQVEQYTGLSLIKSDIICRWESLDSGELPFGPVISINSAKDKDGNDILGQGYSVEGILGHFVNIKAERDSPVAFSYVAGYTPKEVPQTLKVAIMKLASDNFEQRLSVDVSGKMNTYMFPNNWKEAARKFSRRSCWE